MRYRDNTIVPQKFPLKRSYSSSLGKSSCALSSASFSGITPSIGSGKTSFTTTPSIPLPSPPAAFILAASTSSSPQTAPAPWKLPPLFWLRLLAAVEWRITPPLLGDTLTPRGGSGGAFPEVAGRNGRGVFVAERS